MSRLEGNQLLNNFVFPFGLNALNLHCHLSAYHLYVSCLYYVSTLRIHGVRAYSITCCCMDHYD